MPRPVQPMDTHCQADDLSLSTLLSGLYGLRQVVWHRWGYGGTRRKMETCALDLLVIAGSLVCW